MNTEPGRELDALVAEKVMGWTWLDGRIFVEEGALFTEFESKLLQEKVLCPPKCALPVLGRKTSDGFELFSFKALQPPKYSTDIAAALEIRPELEGNWLLVIEDSDGGAFAQFTELVDEQMSAYRARGETIAHAICLAVLKAKKVIP